MGIFNVKIINVNNFEFQFKFDTIYFMGIIFMSDSDSGLEKELEKENNFFLNLASWLADFWKILFGTIIITFFTVLGLIFTVSSSSIYVTYKWIIGIIILLLAGFYVFIQYRLYKERGIISEYKKLSTDLAEKIEKQETENYIFWKDIFHQISIALDFNDTDRISLYKHQEDKFIMLGRHSISPKYDKKGRMSYDAQEGCINKAWLHAECFCNNLPSFEDYPEEYNKICKESYNMSDESLKKIKMKSRTIYAKAICDKIGQKRTAIVVFESINPNAFQKDSINSIFSKYERIICLAIERFKQYEPNPLLAKKEGF